MDWHLEIRKLSTLKDHPKNPRQITGNAEEQLMQSIKRFGFPEKIIINIDGTIIGGHQRKRILKKLGYKEIECWVPNKKLNEKQVDELNIRLNKNQGDWDYDILANEWEFPDLEAWGFDTAQLLEENKEASDNNLEKKVKLKKTCPHCGKEIE